MDAMHDLSTQEPICAIIFDLGRVLVNIDNALLIEELFKGMTAADPQELGRKTMADPAMVEFNCGRIPPAEFHRRMCETYGLNLDYETFMHYWCEIFFTMDGMEHLVKKIAPGITIGLLSDTDPIHWRHIRTTWPWIGAIANPTLSYELGVMKPDPAIYRAAAANVNTAPPQCLFIDDLQSNVDGANAVGMAAIRFENVPSLTRELKALSLLA